MKVTIHDIAKKAGVSIGAVSRALKGDTRISEKTRKRVQAAAKRMSYTPNSIGKGLRTGKSSLIGYLVSSVDDSFYNDILQGIGKVVCKRGYGLLTGITENNSESEIEQIRLFVSKSVDGLIVSNYQQKTAPYLRKLHKKGMPMVICDIESLSPSIPRVVINDSKAAEMICQHLIQMGHRNFVYCFDKNQNSRDRYDDCCKYLQKNGIEKPVFCKDIRHLDSVMSNKKQRPTAVIGYSDFVAVEVMHYLKEKGLSVPEDVSVIGFDDIYFASWPPYNLTTIYQPKVEMGMYAAEYLFQLMEGSNKVSDLFLTPKLIIRKSTGICK